MAIKMNINFLKIPLNKLYFIDEISNFTGLSEEDLTSLKEEYSEEELSGIIESVRWATKNPSYDFSVLLQNSQYSNELIYQFLCRLEKSLTLL